MFCRKRHQRDHPRVLEANHVATEPHLTEAEESELLFCLERHAAEELRAQRVFAALAEDFGGATPAGSFLGYIMARWGFLWISWMRSLGA